MSRAYWAPKSTTRTASVTESGSMAHADALRALEELALGLQGGGDHDLGLLELLDRLVPTGGHGGAEGAEEVHAAIVLMRRAEQDFAQAAAHRGAHPGAAGQRGVEGGHAPVEAAGRGLEGGGQGRSEHDGIGATGDRL